MSQTNLDERTAEAAELVRKYGMGNEISDKHLIRKVKRIIKVKAGVADSELRQKACESVYIAVLSDADMDSDLIIATDNYAQDNGISLNKATVVLIEELVYAIAGGV